MFLIHAVVVGRNAWRHSPTWDEVGHLSAGVGHWEFGRFELYRVNPPLVRTAAALPVTFSQPKTDWRGYESSATGRSEFGLGLRFIETNGPRSFWLFILARWACIPFSLLGAVVCYRWAKELYGAAAGWVALTLWCFSPNILGHAALITPDAHCASFGVLACYVFWRWLKRPSWRGALVCGLALGLCELTKFTWLVLFPLWPVLWMAWRVRVRRAGKTVAVSFRETKAEVGEEETSEQDAEGEEAEGGELRGAHLAERDGYSWRREAWQVAFMLLLAVYVINLGYGFEGSLKKLGEIPFVSERFTGIPADEPRDHDGDNRFAGTWLSQLPVPLPENYLRGIDVQTWEFERKKWSYLRGEWKFGGWWYYYLYALAVKVPLGTWLLAMMAAGMTLFGALRTARWRLRRGQAHFSAVTSEQVDDTARRKMSQTPSEGDARRKMSQTPGWRDEICLLAPIAAVLVLVSSHTGFSHHMRYVLPMFPFAFIWISKVGRVFADFKWKPEGVRHIFRRERRTEKDVSTRRKMSQTPGGVATRVGRLLVAGGLAWSVGSSLWVYPHSLSYFNELAGGPQNGYRHLLNSNIDWGQDLLYLKDWSDEHPEARPLYVAHFVPLVPPRIAGIPSESPPREPQPGWYAVSVNHLYDRTDQFAFLRQRTPVGRIGYSMHVFHVTEHDLRK